MDVLPGYRFVPTDEELIKYYLLRKVAGLRLPCDHILEKNLYGDGANPWDVFDNSNIEDRHWTTLDSPGTNNVKRVIYVFTRLSKVSGNGKNRNIARAAGCGKWDGQTAAKKIFDKFGEEIGFKKMFNFHAKKGESVRDSWIMHEYSLSGASLSSLEELKFRDYVVCKITRTLSKEKFQCEENQKSLSLSEKINIGDFVVCKIKSTLLKEESKSEENQESSSLSDKIDSENKEFGRKRSLMELQVFQEDGSDHKKQKTTKITGTLSKEKFKGEEDQKSLSLSEKIDSQNRVSGTKRSLVELQVSEEEGSGHKKQKTASLVELLQVSEEEGSDHKKQKTTLEAEAEAVNVAEEYLCLDLDEFAWSLDKLLGEDEELEEFGSLIEVDHGVWTSCGEKTRNWKNLAV